MTPREFGEARQLYKFAIAGDCFWEVSKSCEHLITAGTQREDPSYYMASVGIICTYCRPFTDNDPIGMLSPNLVPEEFKELHSYLVELRNKGFAHTDAAGQLPSHGKMTELRFLFTGTHVRSFSSRPIFNPVLLPQIKALTDLLAKRVEEQRKPLLNRAFQVFLSQVPPADKEFELNVEDEKGPMFVASTEPIENKYPIVRPLSDV